MCFIKVTTIIVGMRSEFIRLRVFPRQTLVDKSINKEMFLIATLFQLSYFQKVFLQEIPHIIRRVDEADSMIFGCSYVFVSRNIKKVYVATFYIFKCQNKYYLSS